MIFREIHSTPPLQNPPEGLLILSSVELDAMVPMEENGGKPGLEPVLEKGEQLPFSSCPGLVYPLPDGMGTPSWGLINLNPGSLLGQHSCGSPAGRPLLCTG